MSRTRITDFAGKYREQATRAVARDLARGNGPTISATTKGGDATCARLTTGQCIAAPTSDPAARQTSTWFRIGVRGTQIFPVEVVAAGKGWLDIITPTGAIQKTRTDGEAESYYSTLAEAEAAVYARLQRARERAVDELTQFEGKIGAAAYARARERYNAATRALDDHPLRSR